MPEFTTPLTIRVTPEEHAVISRSAAEAGVSMAAFVRKAALVLSPHQFMGAMEWHAKLAAEAAPESRSTDRPAAKRGRSPVASDPVTEQACRACDEPENKALVHSYGARCGVEPLAKTVAEEPVPTRFPIDLPPGVVAELDRMRAADEAKAGVHPVSKGSSKEAIVADLKEKVAAVASAGKGLQGSGPDEGCAHARVKRVPGASGAVVGVCQDCGERGL